VIEVQVRKDHIGNVVRLHVLSGQAIEQLAAGEFARTVHDGACSGADPGVNQDEPTPWSADEETTQGEFQLAVGVQEAAMRSPLLVRGALEGGGWGLHDTVKYRLDDDVANLHTNA
jgi:hypothetical protein